MHQAAGAIAAAFDLGAVRSLDGPVARGEQGLVWRLDTERGTFAVKESLAPLEEADVARATAFAEAAARAGVPTPAAVRTVDGALLQPLVERPCASSRGRTSARSIAASTPRRSGACWRSCTASATTTGRRSTPGTRSRSARARWRELTAELTARAGPYAAELASLCDELIALDGLVEPPRTLATCHRDLWADNVRGLDGGGLCVIDWDDCGLADPSYELAAVLWEFAVGDAIAPARSTPRTWTRAARAV